VKGFKLEQIAAQVNAALGVPLQEIEAWAGLAGADDVEKK
jgi:hypothetical protein